MRFRDRQAEQAEVAHLGQDGFGNRVVRLNLRLDRAQPLGDETADRLDQLVERLRIERHGGGSNRLGRAGQAPDRPF